MTRATRDGLVSGLILGVLIAFIFALVIRLIPDQWLVDELYRALLYAAQVPAALLFVPIASGVARLKSETPRHVLLWACSAALAFDGLVLGFWPSLYGHDGAALAVVATLLLWAFAWIVAVGLLVTPGEVRASAVRH